MANRLFVVHGSHPCATARKALELKGIDHSIVELPPALHAPVQRVLFGGRTVPALKLDSGDKVQGSTAILRRLEQLRPEPPLYPAERRNEVEEAERWGDEVLQPLVRRLLWVAFSRSPESMVSYQQGSKLPPLPGPVVRAVGPAITRAERRLNAAGEHTVGPDLAALPAHLDRIDGWIADGLLGAEQPTAADLQIGPSVRLLETLADVRSLLEGRPATAWAARLFDRLPGEVPAGVLGERGSALQRERG